jgi:hypothetical protein
VGSEDLYFDAVPAHIHQQGFDSTSRGRPLLGLGVVWEVYPCVKCSNLIRALSRVARLGLHINIET